MSPFTKRERLKIALGGFLSFTGFVVLILMLLVVTGTIDLGNALKPDFIIFVVPVLGALDIIAGVLLLRSE